MANEVSVTTNLVANKGTGNQFSFSRSISMTTITLNTARKATFVQNIGTTAEALSIHADVATLGWCIGRNLDPTNFVEIGRDSGGTFLPLVRVNAGEPFCFRLAQGIAATLHARANTGACDVEFNILND
jgi:hypothetical protein